MSFGRVTLIRVISTCHFDVSLYRRRASIDDKGDQFKCDCLFNLLRDLRCRASIITYYYLFATQKIDELTRTNKELLLLLLLLLCRKRWNVALELRLDEEMPCSINLSRIVSMKGNRNC